MDASPLLAILLSLHFAFRVRDRCMYLQLRILGKEIADFHVYYEASIPEFFSEHQLESAQF